MFFLFMKVSLIHSRKILTLKNKREIWRVTMTLAHLRKAARELLKLEEKDPRRIFEGSALMKRM